MELYEMTIYRAGGLAEWRRFPDLVSAMEYYANDLVTTESVPSGVLIREKCCEVCGEWVTLGAAVRCGRLPVLSGCQDAGWSIGCEGTVWPRQIDLDDDRRLCCDAHHEATQKLVRSRCSYRGDGYRVMCEGSVSEYEAEHEGTRSTVIICEYHHQQSLNGTLGSDNIY